MIGKKISHYTILEQIGQGGMGVVYKAQDTKLNRVVALKFLSQANVGNEADKKRFINEAQAAAALNHPNICAIYEINEVDGQVFIALPFVDGRELTDLIAEGPMPLELALNVATQVAQGLEEAHERGIVHRDIKSSNVMLNQKGRALIMDFGLAKQSGGAALTRAGTSLGTIEYMSPEQAHGTGTDARTDIWSFGVMLYEMIAGRRPFQGDFDQALIYSILNEDPKPVTDYRPDAPDGIVRIIGTCLAKRPEDRYQHASELLAELRALQADLGLRPASDPVYSTSGATAVRTAEPETLWGRMMERRVPHALAVYALVSFAIFQGMHYLVNHFPLSPNLPQFSFVTLASLVPTVLLVSFFHGRRSGARWTKIEGIGIPLNLLLSGIILFTLFQDKDLGAATKTVTATDEAGNVIERDVPKEEFAKRIAIFYFDNETGVEDNDWLSYGFVHMLRFDLAQDDFISYGFGWTRPHMDAGFPKATGSPLTLKRKFARESHYPTFIAAEFSGEAGDYRVEATLYRTEDASAIASHSYRSADIFAMMDSLSVDLRRDLEIPEYHIEKTPNLPISEMFTKSQEAMRLYVLGYNDAVLQRNDFATGAALLDSAVTLDPSFAVAYWRLTFAYNGLNRGDEANAAIESAMKHRYKLPEPVQFELKAQYYGFTQQADAVFENCKRWATLYPLDVTAHTYLANLYEERRQFDEAVASRKRILEIDPTEYVQFREIGRTYEDAGRFQEALPYYEQYAEALPEDYQSLTNIGNLYKNLGEFEKALPYYEKALVMEPDKMWVRTAKIDIERRSGNFDTALEEYENALKSSTSPGDSINVLMGLREFLAFRGQVRLALEVHEEFEEVASRTWSPSGVLSNSIPMAWLYVFAGESERYFERLRAIESGERVFWMDVVVNLGYLIAYSSMDDPANRPDMERRLAEFEEAVERLRAEDNRWAVHLFKAQIDLWNEQYDQALEHAEKGLEIVDKDDLEFNVYLSNTAGRICREAGRYEQAQDFLRRTLVIEPHEPVAHLEMARTYEGLGQRPKAIEHLNHALSVWENADPGHPVVEQARELQAEWGASGLGTP